MITKVTYRFVISYFKDLGYRYSTTVNQKAEVGSRKYEITPPTGAVCTNSSPLHPGLQSAAKTFFTFETYASQKPALNRGKFHKF